MIKYNNSNINDWYYDTSNIIKVYRNNAVCYYKISYTPPTPTFKWLATYVGGTTSSAECDSTSAITNGEITLSNLVSVEIGDCVTTIGLGAFQDCSSITSCTIGSGVTSIGQRAFYNCIGFTSIDIPNSVTSIDSYAFGNCSGLTSIEIPNSVTSIGQQAFYRCTSLTSITVDSNNSVYDSRNNCNAIIETSTNTLIFGCQNTIIPSGVTTIGSNAFQYCTNLTSIDIPDSVTSIGQQAFYRCSGLTSIDIPDSVTTIGSNAFRECTSLTSIDIPDSVTTIGGSAFRSCSGLTSITVNATTPPTLGTNSFANTNDCPIYVPCGSVETYKAASGWSDYASRITCAQPTFQGKWLATYVGGTTSSAECDPSSAITNGEITLSNLASVEIGDCVTNIDVFAFESCTSLTSCTIGSGVTSIGDYAFTQCSGLTSIVIPNGVTSIGDGAFSRCAGLTSINIPDSVTSIAGFAFESCTSLTSCTIGSGVTSISDFAFVDCSGLTSITIFATTPPTLGNPMVFFNTNDCPIYVPSGSVSAYQSAWSDYSSRIQAIPNS